MQARLFEAGAHGRALQHPAQQGLFTQRQKVVDRGTDEAARRTAGQRHRGTTRVRDDVMGVELE